MVATSLLSTAGPYIIGRAIDDGIRAQAHRSNDRVALYSRDLKEISEQFPDAVAALEQLPQNLRQFRPYVRTLEALREDQRRAQGS